MMKTVLLVALLLATRICAAQSAADSPLYVRAGHCASTPPLDASAAPLWNGWGPSVTNTRFQDASAGGITVEDVPKLVLKWAYGLPREQLFFDSFDYAPDTLAKMQPGAV